MENIELTICVNVNFVTQMLDIKINYWNINKKFNHSAF